MCRFLVCCVLWCGASLCFASESISSLYASALKMSPFYLAELADAAAQKENYGIARAALLPSVALTGSVGDGAATRRYGEGVSQDFEYKVYSVNFGVRQPLFRAASYYSYQQGNLDLLQYDVRVSRAQGALLQKIVLEYSGVVSLNDQLDSLRQQLDSLSTQEDAAKKSFSVGFGTRLDLDEIYAKMRSLKVQVFEVESACRSGLRSLSAIVGQKVQSVQRFQPFFLPLPVYANRDELLDLAYLKGDVYRSSALDSERAYLELKKIDAAAYPSFDLYLNRSFSSNDSISNLTKQGDARYVGTSYGVQFNLPIFMGGQISASARQASKRYEKAQEIVRDVRQSIEMEISEDYDYLSEGGGRLGAIEMAIDAAIAQVRADEMGLRAGQRSALDILAAKDQLAYLRVNLSKSRSDLLNRYVRQLVMIGKPISEALETLDAHFQESTSCSLP